MERNSPPDPNICPRLSRLFAKHMHPPEDDARGPRGRELACRRGVQRGEERRQPGVAPELEEGRVAIDFGPALALPQVGIHQVGVGGCRRVGAQHSAQRGPQGPYRHLGNTEVWHRVPFLSVLPAVLLRQHGGSHGHW